jgi:hypothetical protein
VSGRLAQLFEKEGALAVLRVFGLDQVLTDKDDPQLWASALVRHWAALDEPDANPDALRFGIGRIVSEQDPDEIPLARSGMEQVEVWCFDRVDANHLQAVQCPDRPALSVMSMLSGVAPSTESASLGFWGIAYLDLSRPSKGEKGALVHSGTSAPFNVGTGETRYWVLDENGTWTETGEVFSRWLT